MAIHVHFGVLEPTRLKVIGTLPRRWVPPDGVYVDVGCGVSRNAVPTESAFFTAKVRNGQRGRRVQPERLLHDAVQKR